MVRTAWGSLPVKLKDHKAICLLYLKMEINLNTEGDIYMFSLSICCYIMIKIQDDDRIYNSNNDSRFYTSTLL